MLKELSVTGRVVRWGACLGAAGGGLLGLVIGLLAYWPTAPVALFEGAFFGAALGFALSLPIAAVAVLFIGVLDWRAGHGAHR